MCGWKEAGPESPLEWVVGGGEVWLGDGWRGVWGADVVCEIPQGKLRCHRGRGSGHEGRSSDTATTTGDPGLHGNLLHQFNLFVVVAFSFSPAGKNGDKLYKFHQKSGAKQVGSLGRPQSCVSELLFQRFNIKLLMLHVHGASGLPLGCRCLSVSSS